LQSLKQPAREFRLSKEYKRSVCSAWPYFPKILIRAMRAAGNKIIGIRIRNALGLAKLSVMPKLGFGLGTINRSSLGL
jgi:hypothetical protein